MSTSLINTLGIGGTREVVIEPHYLDLTEDTTTSVDYGLADTAQLVPKEDVNRTLFKGLAGDKTLAYDIDLDALFISNLDGGDKAFIEYNLILVDTVIEEHRSSPKEVPVFTVIEPDFGIDNSPFDGVVLKNLCTVTLGVTSQHILNAIDHVYENSLLSSFVDDINVDTDTLMPTTFIWLNKRALQLTVKHMFTDITVDYVSSNGYNGLFDSDSFCLSYGLVSNKATLSDMIWDLTTGTSLSNKFQVVDDSIPLIIYSSNYAGTNTFVANLPTNLRPVKVSDEVVLSGNSAALSPDASTLNVPDILDNSFNRQYIFCYMFNAARTSWVSIPGKDSVEATNMINSHTQTLYPYNGITTIQTVIWLAHSDLDTIEYDLNVIFAPYKVVDVEVFLTVGELTSIDDLAANKVLSVAGNDELKSKYFKDFIVEYDDFGCINYFTINYEDYPADEHAYIVLNWICR